MKDVLYLIRKFLEKPIGEQSFYIEMIFWLGLSRISILVLPFKLIASFLGDHMIESEKINTFKFKSMGTIRLIAIGVRTMSERLPWECKCLVQAITGKRMLDRRNIESTLFLGVGKDENGQMIAHAWLRVGEHIILGGGGLDRFAVVSTFT